MWHDVVGHDAIVEQFRDRLAAGRLASTFLFVGPNGIGKRTFAQKLAQGLLCQHPTNQIDPCGGCDSCRMMQFENHPDLLIVRRPADRSFIPVELFIGSQDKRRREGLCHDIGLKPFLGGRRVAIIDDADFLNLEGANSLLKTLEEPPARSVLILIGSSAARQLPTIRSRCQVVRFQPLSLEEVADLLFASGTVADREEARARAALSSGSVRQAIEASDPSLFEFRRELFAALALGIPDSVRLAGQVSAIVDAAGKEAPRRRARLNQVVQFTTEFYRSLMRHLSGAAIEGDTELQASVLKAADSFPGHVDAAIACLDRTVAAAGEIARNANQSTLIECWLDDLERLASAPLESRL